MRPRTLKKKLCGLKLSILTSSFPSKTWYFYERRSSPLFFPNLVLVQCSRVLYSPPAGFCMVLQRVCCPSDPSTTHPSVPPQSYWGVPTMSPFFPERTNSLLLTSPPLTKPWKSYNFFFLSAPYFPFLTTPLL